MKKAMLIVILNMHTEFKSIMTNLLKKLVATPVMVLIAVIFCGLTPLFGADAPEQYKESDWYDSNKHIKGIYLTTGNEVNISSSEDCLVNIFQNQERTKAYISPMMYFLPNTNGDIVHGVFTNGNDRVVDTKVCLSNPAAQEMIACRCLLDEELRGKFGTNHIDFNMLPVKNITVEVKGPKKIYYYLESPENLLNYSDWDMFLNISQEDFDDFQADLKANKLTFEFHIYAEKVHYDFINIEFHTMVDFIKMLKSVRASGKTEIILDQNSYEKLEEYFVFCLVQNSTVSDPAYLKIVANSTAFARTMINWFLEEKPYTPGEKYLDAERKAFPELPSSVRNEEQGRVNETGQTTKESHVETESKNIDGAFKVGPANLGGGTSNTTQDSTTKENHQVRRDESREGEVGRRISDHKMRRFAIRDGIDGVKLEYTNHITLPLEFKPAFITVISHPTITHDKVTAWYHSYDQKIKTRLDKFNKKDLLKVEQVEDLIKKVNVQISEQMNTFRDNAVAIRNIFAKAGTDSPQGKALDNKCKALMQNGLWKNLKVTIPENNIGTTEDPNNIASFFETKTAGIYDVEKAVDLDAVKESQLFDIKQDSLEWDSLEPDEKLPAIRRFVEKLRNLKAIHYALSQKLKERQNNLDNLIKLNELLKQFISENQ